MGIKEKLALAWRRNVAAKIRELLADAFRGETRVEPMSRGGWKVIVPVIDHIGDCQTLYLSGRSGAWRLSDTGWLASECEATNYVVPPQVMESLLGVYDFQQKPDGEICVDGLKTLKWVFWAVTNYSTLATVVGWMRSYRMTTTEERGSI